LRGCLRAGDRVVTTAAEHSAIARPLRALADQGLIQLEIVPVDGTGLVDPDDVGAALRQRTTRMLVVNHASNVTGVVQDARALCGLARQRDCISLLDASQSAGVLPLAELGADAIIASAHKSLLGPPGLGFVAVPSGLRPSVTKQGGTGSSRAIDRQPTEWPTAFEPGTPNMPAIAGLGAALAWIEESGVAELHAGSVGLIDDLRRDLTERLGDGVRLLGPTRGTRIAVLSFTLRDLDPAEAGMVLDAAGVHVRTGFHCAPWIHACLGTTAGGTVRVSPGPFVTADEVRAVAAALAR
jgi:selenocysteine lyase/cysteine desulfurase